MENLNPTGSPVHSLVQDTDTSSQMPVVKLFIFVAFAVILGIALGYLPHLMGKSTTTSVTGNKVIKVAGVADKSTFKDTAEGILKEGGIDGEGNFHLQRPGGESQNVYLTSTTVDLSLYIGKKVKVWGQTFQGDKAGWLMDVGRIEVLK